MSTKTVNTEEIESESEQTKTRGNCPECEYGNITFDSGDRYCDSCYIVLEDDEMRGSWERSVEVEESSKSVPTFGAGDLGSKWDDYDDGQIAPEDTEKSVQYPWLRKAFRLWSLQEDKSHPSCREYGYDTPSSEAARSVNRKDGYYPQVFLTDTADSLAPTSSYDDLRRVADDIWSEMGYESGRSVANVGGVEIVAVSALIVEMERHTRTLSAEDWFLLQSGQSADDVDCLTGETHVRLDDTRALLDNFCDDVDTASRKTIIARVKEQAASVKRGDAR